MMSVLCCRSSTLQIVDGNQTSLSVPERTQPSSFTTHDAERFGLADTRTDLSLKPETIRLPSGENAIEVTQSVCPCSSLSCSHAFASHTRTHSPPQPETSLLLSNE